MKPTAFNYQDYLDCKVELEAVKIQRIEITHCRDCRHYAPSSKGVGLCKFWQQPTACMGFCHAGEVQE